MTISSDINSASHTMLAIGIIFLFLGLTGIGSFVGGCFYGQQKAKELTDHITVEPAHKNEKPVTKWIVPVPKIKKGSTVTIDDVNNFYLSCYKKPIIFSHVTSANNLLVTASDGCKTASETYKVLPVFYKNTIQLAPGFLLVWDGVKLIPLFGGNISYIHRFGTFEIGASIPIYGSSQKSFVTGANLIFGLSF